MWKAPLSMQQNRSESSRLRLFYEILLERTVLSMPSLFHMTQACDYCTSSRQGLRLQTTGSSSSGSNQEITVLLAKLRP